MDKWRDRGRIKEKAAEEAREREKEGKLWKGRNRRGVGLE